MGLHPQHIGFSSNQVQSLCKILPQKAIMVQQTGLCEKDLYKFDKTFERDNYVETYEEYKVWQDRRLYKLEKGIPKYYTKPRECFVLLYLCKL